MKRLTHQLPRPAKCLTTGPARPRCRPSCRPNARLLHSSTRQLQQEPSSAPEASEPVPIRPTSAPKAVIDIKHIRQNPTLHEQNCVDRNYKPLSSYPARINLLFEHWHEQQRKGRAIRERSNIIRRELANPSAARDEAADDIRNAESQSLRSLSRDTLLAEARALKDELSSIEAAETDLTDEMSRLALALPNLTSTSTPLGVEPLVLSYINEPPENAGHGTGASAVPAPLAPESDRVWRSHVHIGTELGLMDFAGAATTSGWGWYYLLNEGAALEQALVQYALAVATRHGWGQISPPSIVYSHIAAACGFQPRDPHGETQIYALTQSESDAERGRPELCLAGTSEIPLAGMKADAEIASAELPLRRVAVSRCYRAEAGARGVDTKGLYRVHEFTKVEMFAWTAPGETATTEVFDEMVDIQTEILEPLGLHCRVLEMPSADLGASATRKIDIEAFFPSRRGKNGGWGEVTSASICTDYQTRRLATRVRLDGKIAYPWTVNGTALAVPRVLAAILENGWDESDKTVTIPKVLRPWMDGRDKIGLKQHRR